jgi:hypothetical protein
MRKYRWIALAVSTAALIGFAVASGADAQQLPCRAHVPAVGPALDTRALPLIKNLDPCSKRLTMTDDALKATGGPYISRGQAEQIAVGRATPTKVRSYFVTEAQRVQMLGLQSQSTSVYPDREQWLVVVQARDQGPKPSLMPGVKPWPRRYYWMGIDATSGRVLGMGGNEGSGEDWPASLPRD